MEGKYTQRRVNMERGKHTDERYIRESVYIQREFRVHKEAKVTD